MNNYKVKTKNSYNKIASLVSSGYDEYFKTCVQDEADYFLSKLTKASRILDLGCGAGTHLKYFIDNGYDALGIDISSEMINKCIAQNLPVQEMDLENLDFDKNMFDAVWSHTSLIHIPKDNLKNEFSRIYDILKDKGVVFVAVREGDRDGFEIYKDIEDSERWFSNFIECEMNKYFEDYFNLDKFSRKEFKGRSFLNYHLIKK